MNVQDARALSLQISRLEEQTANLRRMAEQILAPEVWTDLAFERQFPLTIYHITPIAYYNSIPATEAYLPQAYAQDGFIHCTRGADLMVMVANRHYRGTPGDFAMLVLDVRVLTSPLKYEALDSSMLIPFPHIYGPINREAIVEIVKMKRGPDGTFLAPPFST